MAERKRRFFDRTDSREVRLVVLLGVGAAIVLLFAGMALSNSLPEWLVGDRGRAEREAKQLKELRKTLRGEIDLTDFYLDIAAESKARALEQLAVHSNDASRVAEIQRELAAFDETIRHLLRLVDEAQIIEPDLRRLEEKIWVIRGARYEAEQANESLWSVMY